MRLIFTCVPSHGRFFTLAGLARAAEGAGHQVLFATAPAIHSLIASAGFAVEHVGADVEQLRRELFAAKPNPALREDQIAGDLFTQRWPESALPQMLSLAKRWHADAIVHEEGEFTAPVLATLLDLPNIAVSWTGPMRYARQWQSLDAALAPLWHSHGLDPPRCAGMFRHLHLDQCVASLQTPVLRPRLPTMRLRPTIYDGAEHWPAESLPQESRVRPLIFVTLGTVAAFNHAPAMFAAIIAALAAEPLSVIVTIGTECRRSELGPLPANVHVTDFVPQSLVAQRCVLTICHGGPGTAMSSLIHGTPLLLIPRGGAVQTRMAVACESAGAARVLPQTDVSTESVREHVAELLRNPGYRLAAQRIGAEIEQMPDASSALERIAQVVTHRPMQSVSSARP